MCLVEIIMTLHMVVHSAWSGDLLALEMDVPKNLGRMLGFDSSVDSVRAALGTGQMFSDLAVEISANKADKTKGISRTGMDEADTKIDLFTMKLKGLLPTVLRMLTLQMLQIPNYNQEEDSPISGSGTMRRELRPLVELSPGTVKTEIMTYPPNFLAARLRHMLKYKEKKDAQEAVVS